MLAVHLSHLLSAWLGIMPACVPYVTGCLSVSAAGRYAPPNYLFDALMIPSGLLLAATWLAAARWV